MNINRSSATASQPTLEALEKGRRRRRRQVQHRFRQIRTLTQQLIERHFHCRGIFVKLARPAANEALIVLPDIERGAKRTNHERLHRGAPSQKVLGRRGDSESCHLALPKDRRIKANSLPITYDSQTGRHVPVGTMEQPS